MKAIIVTDVELNALVDRLELKKFQGDYGADRPTQDQLERAHRFFHYHVVRWIQEVGGEVKRS